MFLVLLTRGIECQWYMWEQKRLPKRADCDWRQKDRDRKISNWCTWRVTASQLYNNSPTLVILVK